MLKVTGLKLNHGRPNARNHRILAYFDCQLPGILLNGCALVWTNKDQLRMWPPRIDGIDPHGRRVEITNWQLMLQIRDAAAHVYLALEGAEPEWVRAQLAQETAPAVCQRPAAPAAPAAEDEGLKRFLAAAG